VPVAAVVVVAAAAEIAVVFQIMFQVRQ